MTPGLSQVICITNRQLVPGSRQNRHQKEEAAPQKTIPPGKVPHRFSRETDEVFAEKDYRAEATTGPDEDWQPFIERLSLIAAARPRALVLREKDLAPADYERLARAVLPICRAAGVPCLLHSHPAIAQRLGADGLHMPLAALAEQSAAERRSFAQLGASCHSLADIATAEQLGCTYVTLGHIYETTCKPGLPPRGRALLREACHAAHIPVYAIGGITPARLPEVLADGAAGACVMSGLMQGREWLGY